MFEVCSALLSVVIVIQIISLVQVNRKMKRIESEVYHLGDSQNDLFKYLNGIEQKMFEIKVEMIARGASGIRNVEVPASQPATQAARRKPGRPFKTPTKEKTP